MTIYEIRETKGYGEKLPKFATKHISHILETLLVWSIELGGVLVTFALTYRQRRYMNKKPYTYHVL